MYKKKNIINYTGERTYFVFDITQNAEYGIGMVIPLESEETRRCHITVKLSNSLSNHKST